MKQSRLLATLAMLTSLLSFIATTAIAAPGEYTHKKWFQILFCQDILHYGFDQAATASTLPAYGFSGDNFDDDGRLHFWRWDLLSGDELQHVTIPRSAGVDRVGLKGVTVATQGNEALIASGNLDLIRFDVTSATVIERYQGLRYGTMDAAYSPDGEWIAAADERYRIWLWPSDQPERPTAVIEVPGRILDIKFSDDSQEMNVWLDDSLKRFSIATGEQLEHIEIAPKLSPRHHAFNRDGSLFAGTGDEKYTFVYDRETAELKWSYLHPPEPGHPAGFPDYVWGHAFTNNGKCLLASLADRFVTFDAESGEVLFEQETSVGHFYMTFSPDDQYLITGGGCNVNVYQIPDECR